MLPTYIPRERTQPYPFGKMPTGARAVKALGAIAKNYQPGEPTPPPTAAKPIAKKPKPAGPQRLALPAGSPARPGLGGRQFRQPGQLGGPAPEFRPGRRAIGAPAPVPGQRAIGDNKPVVWKEQPKAQPRTEKPSAAGPRPGSNPFTGKPTAGPNAGPRASKPTAGPGSSRGTTGPGSSRATGGPGSSRNMGSSSTDHYSALGLKSGASRTDIQRAFRKLSREHHPDLGTSTQDIAARTARYQEITKAYNSLRRLHKF